MKVAIIFLDYQRHEHTTKALENLTRAGYPFDLFTIDKKGVAAALNYGIYTIASTQFKYNNDMGFACNKVIPDYDAIFTMANDIIMPDNWLLKMVQSVIPGKTGIVGIHTVESIGEKDDYGNHPTMMPFGNVLIMKEVIERIGFFNTDHDPYGMQDSDFGYRATKAGFYNYYTPNAKAEHIGHDVGDGSDYRKMKDEGLAIAGEKYNKWVAHYEATGDYYLPFNQE